MFKSILREKKKENVEKRKNNILGDYYEIIHREFILARYCS